MSSWGTCRSCGAEIRWLRTNSDKYMPVDVEPVTGGTIRISGNTAEVLGPLELMATDEPMYVSHFATCPNADQHRKRGDH